MSRARLRSLCCALLVAATSIPAAATQATLADLEAVAGKRLSEASWRQMVGLPLPPSARDLAREHLLGLFREDVFVRATNRWLSERPGANVDQLFAEWLKHYQEILVAGLATLSDDDVAALWRGLFHHRALIDPATCRKLVELGTNDVAAQVIANFSTADLARYLAVLKRGYLAALGNRVPPPLPSEQSVQMAIVQMLAAVPVADREPVIAFMTSASPPSADNCPTLALYARSIEAAPPEAAAVIRRVSLVTGVQALLDPTERWRTPAAPQGAVGGHFQPGEATLAYPREAARAGIQGRMLVRVNVDKTGRAVRVTTIERHFNKPFATLEDGTQLSVEEMFDPMIAVYYKAGRFMQRFENGNPVPYTAEVPLDWKLD